jgi:2-oxo-4-hydroxy-4-carboxy-5-ureidoimidazoline decarboxylase
VNSTLHTWNNASPGTALAAMIACCGSRRWATAMIAMRPMRNLAELSAAADEVWSRMEEADWLEAFACHPRIGGRRSEHASAQSSAWSIQEQSATKEASQRVLAELAAGNALYEKRFGFNYIVCAAGKSAEEMLAILNRRLDDDRSSELREAAEQQHQITQLRLGKWLIA